MRPDADRGRPRLFFYVQHLLGIGHVHRAARIVKALSSDGFDVHVALGGVPSPGLDFGDARPIMLPPVKAGPEGFSGLVRDDGSTFDAAAAARRTALLLDAFERVEPDVLVIEAFPFGRRQMRFELLPLLERALACRRPPLIAASVRDILQRSRRPDRAAETVELVERYFDLVLVHGDPRFTTLEATFPEAGRFAGKIAYTGLVAPEPILADGTAGPRYGAVVSVGGGAVGWPVLEAALQARPMSRLAGKPWLVLTGPNLPHAVAQALERAAQGGVDVRPFVHDLAATLARADLSISQAGYNTVADILVGGCRALVIPFARDGETEQGDRAALLEHRGDAVVVAESALTPSALAAAIDRALAAPAPDRRYDLAGAGTTARLLRSALATHRPEGAV